MPASPEARRDRRLLAAWLAGSFALSALRDPAALGAAWLAAALLLRRGLWRQLRRTARAVLPLTAGLALASLLLARATAGAWPPLAPFGALVLRACLLAFLAFSVLDRVRLLRALAPWPTPSRLLVVTLGQIHALRLLAAESRQGLESRLPRRPGPLDLLRNAGGIAAALFTLAARNAREITDAMRARGF